MSAQPVSEIPLAPGERRFWRHGGSAARNCLKILDSDVDFAVPAARTTRIRPDLAGPLALNLVLFHLASPADTAPEIDLPARRLGRHRRARRVETALPAMDAAGQEAAPHGIFELALCDATGRRWRDVGEPAGMRRLDARARRAFT